MPRLIIRHDAFILEVERTPGIIVAIPRLWASALAIVAAGVSLWALFGGLPGADRTDPAVTFPSLTMSERCDETLVDTAAEPERVYEGVLVLGGYASSFTAVDRLPGRINAIERLNGPGSWWFDFPEASAERRRWSGDFVRHPPTMLAIRFRGARAGRSCSSPMGRYADRVQASEILLIQPF